MAQRFLRSFQAFLSDYGYIIAWVSPVVLLTVIAITITSLVVFHQNPPVLFRNIPFSTDRDHYEHGDFLQVFIDYCRYTNVPFAANVEFRDSIVHRLPPITGPGNEAGCYAEWMTVISIPEALPPGRYTLWGKVSYQVNPLAIRTVTFSTREFEVRE